MVRRVRQVHLVRRVRGALVLTVMHQCTLHPAPDALDALWTREYP
jgi:hypothetical protein